MIDHQFAYSSMSMRKVKEAEFGILFVSRLCSCWHVVADNGCQQHRLRQPSPDPFSSNKLMQIAPNAHGKLHAIIELMALRVREKQRLLRAQVMEQLNRGTLLPLDQKDFRRPRCPTLRDARTTEQLECKQCADGEHCMKQKHPEQLVVICNHGKEMIVMNRAHQDRMLKLGRAVQNLRSFTEKEEAKRMERISRERLKALRADDEEAYMKLIDTAKYTLITHLLRQTDAYLDSLAQAVMAQQNDDVHVDTFNASAEEATDETTFGAQKTIEPDEKGKIDYYAVAHRIKEKVSKQPNILVGGTLKEYQLKGLQWMVSLYSNRHVIPLVLNSSTLTRTNPANPQGRSGPDRYTRPFHSRTSRTKLTPQSYSSAICQRP